MAAASSDALPGDSLYPLKRGMEDISLGMANGDADRGEAYLDQASTRLSEARRLMERGRSGELDHESIGEVRRALDGMTHDATEGHRLLRSAYERDGAIGPIQTLDTFSRSHRASWSSLRDRLPVQLTDISDKVSSVFEAMDQEVAPLKSLLPRTPGTGEHAPPGRCHAGGPGLRGPGPQGSVLLRGARTTARPPAATPKPSGSGSTPADGLLGGGTDGLLDDLPTDGTTPSSPGGASGASPAPDVTLPPLLPGLLPGLGIRRRGRRAVGTAAREEGGRPHRTAPSAVVGRAVLRPAGKLRRRPTGAAPAACTACAGSAPAPGPSG